MENFSIGKYQKHGLYEKYIVEYAVRNVKLGQANFTGGAILVKDIPNKDNPNKIWVVLTPIDAMHGEYYQYNSVAEALNDFDDWSTDPEIVACEVLYRGVTLMQCIRGKVRGAACEEYHKDCARRNKLPNQAEIKNCIECVEKIILDHVT